MSESELRSVVRFGDFELDVEAGHLRRDGRRVELAGQPITLLEVFLRRPGQVVPSEDLRRALWPTDVNVDFEHGLRAVVRRLRAALGDTADEPRWIETVPRRGYRYVGPEPRWVTPQDVRTPERRFPTRTAGGAVLLIVFAAVVSWMVFADRAETPPVRTVLAVLTPDNLTGDAGYDIFCQRLADELVGRLGELDPERLGVVARADSARFETVTELTYALRVDYVMEMGVQMSDGQSRVNARLIRIGDRTQVLSDAFVGPADATASTADLAARISASVGAALDLH